MESKSSYWGHVQLDSVARYATWLEELASRAYIIASGEALFQAMALTDWRKLVSESCSCVEPEQSAS